MGKSAPSPPPPPDPYAVSRAEAGSNIMTSTANAWMTNANEYNPFGQLEYSVQRYEPVRDIFRDKDGNPVLDDDGNVRYYEYQVPVFNRTQSMSPQQDQLYQSGLNTQLALSDFANTQTGALSQSLRDPFTINGTTVQRRDLVSPETYVPGGVSYQQGQNGANGYFDYSNYHEDLFSDRLSGSDFVNQAYGQILGRSATPEELAYAQYYEDQMRGTQIDPTIDRYSEINTVDPFLNMALYDAYGREAKEGEIDYLRSVYAGGAGLPTTFEYDYDEFGNIVSETPLTYEDYVGGQQAVLDYMRQSADWDPRYEGSRSAAELQTELMDQLRQGQEFQDYITNYSPAQYNEYEEYVPGLDLGDRVNELNFDRVGPGPDFTTELGLQTSVDPTTGQLMYGPGAGYNTDFNTQNVDQFSSDGLGNIQNWVGPSQSVMDADLAGGRDSVEQALMDRMDPYLQDRRQALEAQLVNQGIVSGSEAWRESIDDFNRQENDARLAAIAQAGQEHSRLFDIAAQQGVFANAAQQQGFDQALGASAFNADVANQNNQWAQNRADFTNNALLSQLEVNNAAQQANFMQNLGLAQFGNDATAQNAAFRNDMLQAGYQNNVNQLMQNNQLTAEEANFQNAAREYGIQEALMQRQMPINEISGLMGLTGVQLPQFTPYTANPMAAPDVSGNAYRSAELELRGWEAQMRAEAQNNAALWGALGTLGAGFFRSDIRLKKNVVLAGHDVKNDLPVYQFRYIWDAPNTPLYIGYMAQDVAQKRPDLVYEINGYLAIRQTEDLPFLDGERVVH